MLSLRGRLTLWYTLTLLAVLLLFAAGVIWQQGRIGRRHLGRELDALAATTANVVQEEFDEDPELAAVSAEALATIDAPGRAIAVVNGAQVLAARWNGLPPDSVLPVAPGNRTWTVSASPVAWRVHTREQTLGASAVTILTAAPMSEVDRDQASAREAMVVGIPLALLLAGAGGLWLAAVGLRPITGMALRASRIPLTGEEDLGQPLRRDELGELTLAFNGLVARLRSALATQRQFMADASHELRTPVSVVRTAAEVMLSRDRRDEAEYREALAIVGGESRRLGRLVDDMLVLARADAGEYPLQRVDLYLNDVIADSCRAVDVLASQRGVTVRVGELPEVPFRGDEDLLRQLMLNLVQNGVQHSPAGGMVMVSAATGHGNVDVRVADSGAGIPAEARERIFDRFVQLDASRRSEGTGLGLPIARWIAEVHGGTLKVERSGTDGTVFCVTFPAGTAS